MGISLFYDTMNLVMKMKTILIVEDDEHIQMSLKEVLETKNYFVYQAYNQKEALQQLSDTIQLIILDIQLPDGNGIQLCRQIREKYMMPILFLTCRQDEETIVEGLNAGGDDYVCKPFGMKELYARMEALLRRVPHFHDVIHVGDLMIDVKSYQVFKQGQLLDLGLIPYYILIHLIEHQGIVVTRQQLLMMIESQTGHDLEDNTLSVHMKRLREKIGTYHGSYIETIRGVGYRWIQK